MDVYWGTELYPRVGGVDFKVLFIARYGIVLWGLFAISFACKTAAMVDDGRLLPHNDQLVSTTLMVCYIAKFFFWEKWHGVLVFDQSV
jgi:7-dehydrocholesterol reductase